MPTLTGLLVGIRQLCQYNFKNLAFWGDNEALTAKKSEDCTIPLKRLRYSNRAVSNSK